MSSSRAALVEMDVLDRIFNYIIKIANDTNDCYNILICGDLNSRVGNEKDYVVFDNDANIEILPIDYNIDVHIPRFSQDSIEIQYKYLQILYSLRITTCNQHEVHNLTRLFCYNNTKWLIDLGREKSQF